ncbi:hypothetical protein [Bacillus sp. FSL K6-1284]|uniref:hypothetical protein n=1 Tax=Bacillus sp. FSL K6-1284 TaxID=2921468 RepID=UPI0030FCAEE7
MRKVWLVETRCNDDFEEKEVLATFTEEEEGGLLHYLSGLLIDNDRFLKKLFEIDMLKGELFEMEPKISNGKLKIEYVDQ